MPFDITLQRNLSEPERVTKTVEDLLTVTGDLREGTSIIDPVILFNADLSALVNCNYMTIDTFGRKYFVRNIRSIRAGLVEISAHVDVLSSFADAIKTNYAIIKRQEADFNLYLNDGSLRTYSDPKILTYPFPSGFSGDIEYVLAVAGG